MFWGHEHKWVKFSKRRRLTIMGNPVPPAKELKHMPCTPGSGRQQARSPNGSCHLLPCLEPHHNTALCKPAALMPWKGKRKPGVSSCIVMAEGRKQYLWPTEQGQGNGDTDSQMFPGAGMQMHRFPWGQPLQVKRLWAVMPPAACSNTIQHRNCTNTWTS